MKKFSRYILFLLFAIMLCFPSKAMASTIRSICINGEDSEKEYLYSASLFASGIRGYYLNGIKINSVSYRDNPSYSDLGKILLDYAAKAKSDDITLFYYSGHGTDSDGTKGLYVKNGLNYTFSKLYSDLNKIPGKKLVILDCCYSGDFISQVNRDKKFDKKNFYIITACKADQYSNFYNKLRILSIFGKKVNVTRFSNSVYEALGLDGKKLRADAGKKDNIVTGKEIFDYVSKKCKKSFSYTDKKTGKKYKLNATPLSAGNAIFKFSKTASKDTKSSTKASLKLNKTSASMYVTESSPIKATATGKSKTVSWKSSNIKVATVKNGVVTAKTAGTATITATANGIKKTCKVTVKGDWYQKVLKTTVGTYKVNAGYGSLETVYRSMFSYYKVYDINGDGVKELFLTTTPSDFFSYNESGILLTYYKGKVTPLMKLSSGAGMRCTGKNKTFCRYWRTAGQNAYEIYTLKDGKLKQILFLEDDNYGYKNGRQVHVWRIDNKETTEKNYNSYLKKYVSTWFTYKRIP